MHDWTCVAGGGGGGGWKMGEVSVVCQTMPTLLVIDS